MSDNTKSERGVVVETGALKALEFYSKNYETLSFTGLGPGRKKIVLGKEPLFCRFCRKGDPKKTFKKRAHAVSELLGNKTMTSLYECDECNERFSTFEDDLAKMTYVNRAIGGVRGKNGSPTLVGPDNGLNRKLRIQHRDGGLHFSHEAGDINIVEDEENKSIKITYVQQAYRPLGAYKALCKSVFTIIPDDDLEFFEELRQWLLCPDLITNRVYSDGSHICHTTFVPVHQPFREPLVCLLRRKTQIDAPYISLFIATGNYSYQIFPPCPSKDSHMLKKTTLVTIYPHIYQLQPWIISASVFSKTLDLSSADRTKQTTGHFGWTYERKEKIV